jgi:Hemerythrin HHE cation binding domain
MPNVFEVLRTDHDEVKAMLARLEDGPTARGGATGEQLAQRKRLVDELIIEESKHEAAEQQYFWPAVRALGPEGDRVADQAIEQEITGESALDELDKLSPDDQQFETVLTTFTSEARAHIAFEEAHAWPLLGATLNQEQAEDLGDKVYQAKKMAPTRPHPRTPPKEGVQKTAGPVAGAADRLRDAVTGRGRDS